MALSACRFFVAVCMGNVWPGSTAFVNAARAPE